MFRKIKFKLLEWLIDDIVRTLNDKPGCSIINNIRASAEIKYMAMIAWRLGGFTKREEN